MSSYILPPVHFNSVETSIKNLLTDPEFMIVSYPLPKLNYSKNTLQQRTKTITQTFNQIRKLSAICVCLQYRHHYPHGTLNSAIETETKMLIDNQKTAKPLSNCGLYNAIICIDYQIEIQHLEELRPLSQAEREAYDLLHELITAIAHLIAKIQAKSDPVQWEISE